MTYANETDIEGIIGYAVVVASLAVSRPTTEQLTIMLGLADSIINAEARRTTNATDTSERLKVIACSLVQKMILNMFALTDPDIYDFSEVELTDDQKRIIHIELGVWDSLTWEIGG